MALAMTFPLSFQITGEGEYELSLFIAKKEEGLFTVAFLERTMILKKKEGTREKGKNMRARETMKRQWLRCVNILLQ